jgi:hypothetical protein
MVLGCVCPLHHPCKEAGCGDHLSVRSCSSEGSDGSLTVTEPIDVELDLALVLTAHSHALSAAGKRCL